MEPPTPPKRPSKRRRTKGVLRLVEGDDGLADGIIVTTTVKQTPNGEVEERIEVPVWKNMPTKSSSAAIKSSAATQSNIDTHFNNDQMHVDDGFYQDTDYPPVDQSSRNTKTQSDYIQEFVDRIHPMLNALLSREVRSTNPICGCCPVGNIAAWRCRDCTAARILCRACIRNLHMDCPTHRIEVWTGAYYRPAELWEVGLYILINHHTEPKQCANLAFQQSILQRFQQRKDRLEQDRLAKGNFGVHQGTSGSTHEHNKMDVAEDLAPSNDQTFEAQQHEDAQFSSCLDKLYKESQDAFDNHKGNIDEIFDLDDNICDDDIVEVLSLPTDYIPCPGAAATSSDIPPPESDENIGETPKTDGLDNPYVRVVHSNGIHHMAMVYCSCRGKETTNADIMAAGLFPTSFGRYRTVFTHAVLDDYRLSNLECKASAYQYFQKLRRQTSPMAPDTVPNLYHELRRTSRLWRWMKKLKWAGIAHRSHTSLETQPGELANFCPACPQPGINLPDNWSKDPNRYCE